MTVTQEEATRDKIDIIRWCRSVSFNDENLFVKLLRKNLSDRQITEVLKVLEDMCPHCFDAGSGCQCWNDD